MPREQKFKAGDRVRILGHTSDRNIGREATVIIDDGMPTLPLRVEYSPGHTELFNYEDVELVVQPHTDAQKLRDAAEVLGIGSTLAGLLLAEAARLEAASAPKPPSLREAAKAVLECSSAGNFAALRAALSREEG